MDPLSEKKTKQNLKIVRYIRQSKYLRTTTYGALEDDNEIE